MEAETEQEKPKDYNLLPTMKRFHESGAQIRCIVGPVGSGKTSTAAMEICHYLPRFLKERYKILKSRWVVVRNTYRELIDTTQKAVVDPVEGWFPNGEGKGPDSINYTVRHDDGVESELWFRSCDRVQDLKKFKSLQVTGYWIDESIEVAEEIKRMLKTRIGRYPKKCPVRFGLETTNPPDVEHPTYWQFKWDTPPPGPVPEYPPGVNGPLDKHEGFWQPPHENDANLRPRYYADLEADYADNPDWIAMYIRGEPGIIQKGKLVYYRFKRAIHVAQGPLVWTGDTLYRGWDNSGNIPACVVVQSPSPRQFQFLKEFWSDKMGIVDFAKYVMAKCNILYPNAEYFDWGDPAGETPFSKKGGGFTSNAELMRESGVDVQASEQNLRARVESIESQLGIYDGILIDPSMTRFINGFLGGYCYPEIGTTGIFSDKILKNRFSHVHEAAQYVMVKLIKNLPKHKVKRVRGWRTAAEADDSWKTV